MAQEDGPSRPGLESVGRYQKQHRIGEGTYGIVYLASDRVTGKPVALKRFNDEVGREQDTLSYGRWEFDLLNKIKHPNIIAARQLVASDSKSIFMVYDYCEHDLHILISTQKYPYTEAKVKCILRQILLGVQHMHKHGYMHRDLKAANILMDRHGNVKLCDFGSATQYATGEQLERNIEAHTPNVTTRFYSAPEVLLGSETYNEKCDSWAVGCILGELIRSTHLFPGDNDLEMIRLWSELLGSPHHEWKEFSRLPGASLLKPFGRRPNQISKELWDISDQGQALLKGLLSFDPQTRLSATEALQHPWFEEAPLPVEPAALAQMPSTLEKKAHLRKQGIKEITEAVKKQLEKRKREDEQSDEDAQQNRRRLQNCL